MSVGHGLVRQLRQVKRVDELLKEALGFKDERVEELLQQAKRLAEVYSSQTPPGACAPVDIRVRYLRLKV